MTFDPAKVWTVIAAMAVGTFLIRFSFLGLIGKRKLPEPVLRHLRYTPVAILPGLVTPLVLWPQATGGETDPARLLAALVTLAVSYRFKSLVAGVGAGAVVLYLSLSSSTW